MTSPQAFFLTAHFSEEDYPYEWLMLWLSRRPEWQRSREFETTTNSSSPGYYGYRESDNAFGDDEGVASAGGDEEVSGKSRMRVVFQPTTDTTHTIFYRGHWLRVRRGRKSNGYEMLSIRYARPRTRGPPHSVVPPRLTHYLPPGNRLLPTSVSWHGTIRSSSSSYCRQKRSTRPKPSTAFKSISRIPTAPGVTQTHGISALFPLLF